MRLRVTLLILLAINAAAPRSEAGTLTRELFLQIRAVSNEIQALCPPSDCVVIGVGRSPAAIVADLQNQASDYAYNVPLSSFRHNPEFQKMDPPLKGSERWYEDRFEPLNNADEKKLFSHLKRFLPRFSKKGPKRVLVIDYCVDGYSVFAFQKYLERYFRFKAADVAVSSLPIVRERNAYKIEPLARRYGVEDFHPFVLYSDNPLEQVLHGGDFEEYSEYPGYLIGSGDLSTTPSKAYLGFKKELLKLDHESCLPGVNRGLSE